MRLLPPAADPAAKVRRALTLALLCSVIAVFSGELYFPALFHPLVEAPVSAVKQSAAQRAASAAAFRTHGLHRSGDKVLVISRWREDTSWLPTYFADFPAVVYTPGLPGAVFTTPNNKGNEAGPFLAYIIENYDRLPQHMAFLHGHRISHHTLNLDIVPVIKAIRWGAMPYLPLNQHMYHLTNEENPEYKDIARVWPVLFTDIAPQMPEFILSWCCAQFVVTRAAVRSRPKAFYEKIYEWINNRNLELGNVTSFISSRVLEQTWHMVFGMPAKADIIPLCDIFYCDILDTMTEQVERWEGTPFDRIPCKVYDIKHVQDWKTRVSPTQEPPGPIKILAHAPSEEEAARMLNETQAREEAEEREKDADHGRRLSGELRQALKLENTEIAKYQTGYGILQTPPLARDSEEEIVRKHRREHGG